MKKKKKFKNYDLRRKEQVIAEILSSYSWYCSWVLKQEKLLVLSQHSLDWLLIPCLIQHVKPSKYHVSTFDIRSGFILIDWLIMYIPPHMGVFTLHYFEVKLLIDVSGHLRKKTWLGSCCMPWNQQFVDIKYLLLRVCCTMYYQLTPSQYCWLLIVKILSNISKHIEMLLMMDINV